MKPIIVFLALNYLLIAAPCDLHAGGETAGARASALGGASVSLTDFWSIQNNPAGLAIQPYLSAGVYYENRFLLQELSLKSAAIVAPTRYGVLGVSFNQFGYKLYNENKFGLAYARSFGDLLRIGLQLDYKTTHVSEGYKDVGYVSFELGFQSTLNEKISIGAYVYNPMRMKTTNYSGEIVPIVMRVGFTYSFMPEFIGVVEIKKKLETNASLHLGLEYAFQNRFFLRTGLCTNEGYTLGAGIHYNRLQFHLAASIHQRLGLSTQAGLIYQFIKNQPNE